MAQDEEVRRQTGRQGHILRPGSLLCPPVPGCPSEQQDNDSWRPGLLHSSAGPDSGPDSRIGIHGRHCRPDIGIQGYPVLHHPGDKGPGGGQGQGVAVMTGYRAEQLEELAKGWTIEKITGKRI